MAAKWILFPFLSFLVFLKFRKGIFSFREHEPYMFAAAQGLLALLFINGGFFFEDPFTPRQMLSWALMLASAAVAVSGFYGLRRFGRAVDDWENTTRLVREGVFRYIRHPLYASLMFLTAGIFLKNPSGWAAAAGVFTLAFLVAASRVEEGENTAKFGDDYRRYQEATKRYLPFIV